MKNKLKYKLLLVSVGIIPFFIFLNNIPVTDVDEVFLLTDGFEGCVYIHYNQPNKEELKIVDKKIVYEVPTNETIDFVVSQLNLSTHIKSIWEMSLFLVLIRICTVFLS